MTAPHIERMKDELAQLTDRTTKLSEFISASPIFKQLHADERELMRDQQRAMMEYHDVLETRINLAERSQ